MRCWVRQEGRGRTQTLKFLMRSMVFSLLMLYTSRLRAGWSYQHTTLRQQTSCHPWHHRTVMGHHSRHVPRASFFFKACLSGNMKDFCIVQHHVFILNFLFFSSLDCFKHWIKAANYCQGKLSSYTNPASFHMVAKVLLMQELKTQWKLVTELIHTYISVLQEHLRWLLG